MCWRAKLPEGGGLEGPIRPLMRRHITSGIQSRVIVFHVTGSTALARELRQQVRLVTNAINANHNVFVLCSERM